MFVYFDLFKERGQLNGSSDPGGNIKRRLCPSEYYLNAHSLSHSFSHSFKLYEVQHTPWARSLCSIGVSGCYPYSVCDECDDVIVYTTTYLTECSTASASATATATATSQKIITVYEDECDVCPYTVFGVFPVTYCDIIPYTRTVIVQATTLLYPDCLTTTYVTPVPDLLPCHFRINCTADTYYANDYCVHCLFERWNPGTLSLLCLLRRMVEMLILCNAHLSHWTHYACLSYHCTSNKDLHWQQRTTINLNWAKRWCISLSLWWKWCKCQCQRQC